MEKFKKILFFLNAKEIESSVYLLIMIITMAILDMIGVASVLPFMMVLTKPEFIETNIWLSQVFKTSSIFGVDSYDDFFYFMGILVFACLIISLVFKSFATYVIVKFIQMREFSISKRLIEGYLRQPYSWFLNNHSADLGKSILSEVTQITGSAIRPLFELISKGTISIALVILLFLVDAKMALLVSLLFSISYLLIFFILKNYLKFIGHERFKNNELRFLSVIEVFGAIKEVKLMGLENNYIKKFSKSAKIYAQTMALSQSISQIPRFILEIIAIGGILLILIFIQNHNGNINDAIPLISLYVFAGYRLMPALQQVYSAFTQVTFVGPAINKLYEDLKKIKLIKDTENKNILSFKKSIILKNINYGYPKTSKLTLRDVNLEIHANTIVGLVGASGSGKTTLVDIVLGLLTAQSGTLQIDDIIITPQNSKSWMKVIGYVPQHIYLSDDTIAANVAFGLESKDVNQEKVQVASKIAKLHDFIMSELPNQYHTKVGERGVRLSGGQRQRIGIARALYNNPKVLILDEATSALDNDTEQMVMDAIYSLDKDITIILIAHRLNTLKRCDYIYKFNKGQLLRYNSINEIESSKKKN